MADWKPWLVFAATCAGAVIIALLATGLVSLIVRLAAKRTRWAPSLTEHARMPFRVLLLIVALWIAVTATLPVRGWGHTVWHGFLMLTIAAGAWLVGALIVFLEDLGLSRYPVDVPDNRVARRLRTQLMILRRVTVVVVVVLGIGAILLTFPRVQAVGASVLASAGILSVIGGLAAQSTLGNVFAGMQLAFTDAIRIDDVVVVENQWGRIEEITLTYIVVHVWDDRRLVLPSSYFTTTPFENWTRSTSQLLGSVEFDLDWRVAPSQMRAHLHEVIHKTALWDGRVAVLQVTDAVGGYVHVRILVTAKDAPTLFDLRCHVREAMVEWLHETSPQALPRTRVQMVGEEQAQRRRKQPATGPTGLFTGDKDAEQRASQFTGTLPIVERKIEEK